MERITPKTLEEIKVAIDWAGGEGHAFEILGGGTKRAVGHAVTAGHQLDLSACSGVTLYEPEELVLSVKAGTPLSEVENLLADHQQHLAFEPPDFRNILGTDGKSTLGGLVAAGLAGPRRLQAGAVRDHVLGFNAVNGRGEIFKSGGRVVKNVTGFDLSKLMTGSFGALAVLHDITLKVLPTPERTATLLWQGLSSDEALAVMSAAFASSHAPSAAAYIPGSLCKGPWFPKGLIENRGVTAIRIEGMAEGIGARRDGLMQAIARTGIEFLEDEGARDFWRHIRDVNPLQHKPEASIWNITLPPSKAISMAGVLLAESEAEMFFDWAGGLIWLAVDAGERAAAIIRRISTAHGGKATLFRAGSNGENAPPRFHPKPKPLAELEGRIKKAFDPSNILNPGRMGDA